MIGRMTAPAARMMSALHPGGKFRKLRFQTIANTECGRTR